MIMERLRYMVIELWENNPIPLFVVVEGEEDSVYTTDDLEEAIIQAEDCQDGIVLDLETRRILDKSNNYKID